LFSASDNHPFAAAISCHPVRRRFASQIVAPMPPCFRKSIVIATIAYLLTASCSAPQHPDWSRYEYRYMDGQFVAPYRDFPEGRERGEWQCYDGKIHRAFDCTFVHGGWDQYQFIYREKR